MRLNPESIARASSHEPWRVVVGWVVIMVLAVAAAYLFLGDALTTAFDFTDKPESKRAELLLEELRGPETFTEILVVTSSSLSTDDPAFETYIDQLTGAIEALNQDPEWDGPDRILAVFSVGEDGQPAVSPDGRSRLVTVVLANTDLDEASDDAIDLKDAIATVNAPDGVTPRLFGEASINNDFVRLAEEGLLKGELIGIPVALIVLLVVIGAAVAASLPILLAIAAISMAFGLTALVGQVIDQSFFVTNFITMIGLAVGIDYALFIVARYREERVRGFDKIEAIGRTGATANRAVFFSGLTVVLALSGLLFVPNTIFRSLAIGAILVVLLAMAASMTLLPAVISLLGNRINAGRVRRTGSLQNVDKIGGFWDKITGWVMGRPLAWLAGGVALMAVLAISFFSMDTGFSGITTLPDDLDSKQGFEILRDDFNSGGADAPVRIVVDGPITPDVESALARLQASMAADAIFGPPEPLDVNDAGNLALLSVPLSDDFASDAATSAIESLRSDLVPAAFEGTGVDVLVGGNSAFNVDFFDDVSTFTPIVFAWVLGLSFLLLTVVFRSIVLPVKAILMNLLSVGAAYGAVVIVFQAGTGPSWAKSIFGFQQVEGIEAWLPLFLFAVLFGLSMDYHVFLLTRIREHFDRTGDNQIAVAHGLRTTGAIITGAALIMVAVFGGFAAGDLVPLQQMGFGLAIAIFLDATIVRSILVPAAMRLLGDYNWYLPRWLQWLPEIEIEGHEAAATAHDREAEPVAAGGAD